MSDASRFLGAMAAGVAVVAGRRKDDVRAAAVPSLASYSIDPPSVMLSVPAALRGFLSGCFGVSLLAAGQSDVAEPLWERVSTPPSFIERDGAVLIPDALAHLSCRADEVETVSERALVVAVVTEATVRRGLPLMWLDGRIHPGGGRT